MSNKEQLLIRIPDELAQRLRRQVPARGRSAFVQHLLEQALAPGDSVDDPLYRAALAVETDERLTAEMAEWDNTVADGLEHHPPRRDHPSDKDARLTETARAQADPLRSDWALETDNAAARRE